MTQTSRRAVGVAGEDRATDWYRARGYEVLDRNWRGSQGELDLVLRRGGTVVFSEVKARRTDRFGAPFEAVTRAKQLRLRRLAVEWLAARGPELMSRPHELRFDVVSVFGPHLEVFEAAF